MKPQGHLFATTIGQNHLKEMASWIQQVNHGTDFVSFGSPLTLENGLEQLRQLFPQVTLSRYPDSLQVTEVKPIIAFIRSTIHSTVLSEEELANLEDDLELELKKKGSIFITKDSGLFEAIK